MSLADFGYDPDHPVGRDHEIPDRLIARLQKAPLTARDGVGRARYTRALNPTELQVVTYLSHGLRARMVADALGISLATVTSAIATARFKLRAKNQAQAVANALRQGLIR